MHNQKDIVGLLLAAGQSRRFGSNKLLYKINDEPMAVLAARTLKSAIPNSIAIIRPHDRELRILLENEGLRVLECHNAEQGMGCSLACGIKNSWLANGWVVTLADMPFVRQDTIQDVARAIHNNASIIAPQHNGRRGHPVGFSHHYRESLASLKSDSGAREIISHNKAALFEIIVNDAGALIDVDIRPPLTEPFISIL